MCLLRPRKVCVRCVTSLFRVLRIPMGDPCCGIVLSAGAGGGESWPAMSA